MTGPSESEMTCPAVMRPMPEAGSRFYGQVAPFPLPHFSQPCRGSCRAAFAAHSPPPAGTCPATPAVPCGFLPDPLLRHALPVGPALTGFPSACPALSGHRVLDLGRDTLLAGRPWPASGWAAYRQLLLLRYVRQSGRDRCTGLCPVFWRKSHRHRRLVPALRGNVLLRHFFPRGTPAWRRRRGLQPAFLPA